MRKGGVLVLFEENKRFAMSDFIVVLVIIGILAAIAIPHQIAKQNREKVEYNINYLQIKINDYYRDKGMYPYSVIEMVRYGYLDKKGFENPYSNTWQQPIDGQAVSIGQIGYEFLDSNDIKYRITTRIGNDLITRIGK